MKDVENWTTNKGRAATTYAAIFRSKSGPPFEKSLLTREQCKKEIDEWKKTTTDQGIVEK